ncbi:hypothetical protein LPJ64_004512 [Coemansia asiatica]|uniref:DUF1754-domain-containing protein n=1 Tax=Coemansia asiatica TaxID=1052880 RepID=A0A9W8CJ16_9FUNG|nr:hypothetical protein LPJ64_004512 [Coemansia asiatica]
MSDAYEYGVANGPLKLKKPKDLFKKTSSSSKDKHKHKHGKRKNREKHKKKHEGQNIDDSKDHEETTSEEPPLDSKEALTEAEKKYREALHQRKLERIDRLASKSYRDRVKEFNEKLERAPEHHDMPKVGPG